MKRVGAPRKLSPEEEAAILAWYAEYRRVLNELAKFGSTRTKAREFGVSPSTVSAVTNRLRVKLKRCGVSA